MKKNLNILFLSFLFYSCLFYSCQFKDYGLEQGFFRKYAKTTQKTTKFTTWRRFIWATFALTKLFNLFAASSICANPISKCRKKFRLRRMTGPKFFATFGDGANSLPRFHA